MSIFSAGPHELAETIVYYFVWQIILLCVVGACRCVSIIYSAAYGNYQVSRISPGLSPRELFLTSKSGFLTALKYPLQEV